MITDKNKRFLAQYGDYPTKKILMNDPDHDVRQHVAEQEDISQEDLHELSKDEYRGVRFFVGNNKKTHPDTLLNLSVDKEAGIRRIVARNPNTHTSILHRMRNDQSPMVRMEAIESLYKRGE